MLHCYKTRYVIAISSCPRFCPPRHKGFALWLLPLCYSKSRVASVSAKVSAPRTLALWLFDVIGSGELHLHSSAAVHPPAVIPQLITTWNYTASDVFVFMGINFQKWTFRVHENVLYTLFSNSSPARYTLIQPSQAFVQPRSPTPLSSTSFLLNPLCFSVFISIDVLAGFADFNHDGLLEVFVPGFLYTYS